MASNLLILDSRSTISGLNTAVNTWHIRTSGAVSITEANNLLAVFKTFYDAIAAYRNSTTTVITGSRVLLADTSTWVLPTGKPGLPGYVAGHFASPPLIIGATPATSINGTGGSPIPAQLATVISWRTAISGRSGRGRTYLGNMGAALQAGPVIAAAAVTAINNAATALVSGIPAVSVASGVCGLTIWSPTKGNTHDVIGGSSDATFDTMRSRVK